MSNMWYLLGCDALINEVKNKWTPGTDEEQKPEQEQDAVFARVWCTYQWFQELMGTDEIMQL